MDFLKHTKSAQRIMDNTKENLIDIINKMVFNYEDKIINFNIPIEIGEDDDCVMQLKITQCVKTKGTIFLKDEYDTPQVIDIRNFTVSELFAFICGFETQYGNAEIVVNLTPKN